MSELNKIFNDLNFPNAHALYWYTGLYLGLPRVFMNTVRNKLVCDSNIQSILIPVYKVTDPVSGNIISVNITDHYFFIGTDKEIETESDIGLHNHPNISLIRDTNDKRYPSKITPVRIQQIINTHIKKRGSTIQEDVTVQITGGTFKNWYGVVQEKSYSDLEHIDIKFTSDEYECITKMPTVLCKTTC